MEPGLAVAGWLLAAVTAALDLGSCRARAGTQEAVARACHELRGPLGAARLGLHLGVRGELSVARIEAIDLELERAGLALGDLMALQERHRRVAGVGHDPPELVDLAELLRTSVEAWRATALARRARLELVLTGPPALVAGDRLRLAQASENLIANAIEHGGGRVQVRCRSERDAVRLEVTDDGPGLPAPVAELVRRPRGGRGARGRGLAIAAGVAEQHGGRLSAAPSRHGARLVLELPRAPEADAQAPPGDAQAPHVEQLPAS